MTRYWKPIYCSTDPRVDEDHRTLFKLLDRLATLRRESDTEDLNQVLDQLLVYTFEHFAREERAMEESGYPRRGRHSEEHVAVRKALIEALRQVMRGDMGIPVFVGHLKESLTYHFETADLPFVTWQLHHQEEAGASHAPTAR
jgi:hemerythrin-like metal-binding protein